MLIRVLKKVFGKRVIKSNWQVSCPDYGFVADTNMDALCERFDELIAEISVNKIDPLIPGKIDDLLAELKAIQAKGGQQLKDYLAPYFKIAERHKAGEWGDRGPRTIPGGWKRFRTANNWQD